MRNAAVMGLVLAIGTTGAWAGSVPIAAPAVAIPPAAVTPPGGPVVSAPPGLSSRLHVRGQKWAAPQLQRSEAGLSVTLSPKVTLELNYERTAQAPTMPHDHDDGFLTRLKFGF